MTKETLDKLTLLQDALNELITTNWKENRTELDFIVANHQEMAELIDTAVESDGSEKKSAMGWKWWKGKAGERTMDSVEWDNLQPAVIDNVKIELTDLLFFTLSQKGLGDLSDPDEFVVLNDNDWINFMTISANNILQRPGSALRLILLLAERLDFNISAYYCSKHLLNYFRQLDGYQNGSYTKVKNGIEDNELLHDIIKDISIDDMDIDFEKQYNVIAERFFKVFKVEKEEVNYEFWMTIIKSQ